MISSKNILDLKNNSIILETKSDNFIFWKGWKLKNFLEIKPKFTYFTRMTISEFRKMKAREKKNQNPLIL